MKEPQQGERHHTKATSHRFGTSRKERERHEIRFVEDHEQGMGDFQKVQNELFGSPAQSMEQCEGKERERRQDRIREEGRRMPRGCENLEGLAEYRL